jgi:hypothetical protein
MKSRSIYLTAQMFLEAKDADKFGTISHHIDMVTDFKRDTNNLMFKFGLSSTLDADTKTYFLNKHIVNSEMLDPIFDERGNKVKIDSVASFSGLSDAIMEKVLIVAVAPIDMRAGVAVLKALKVVPAGREEHYKEVIRTDLSIYNYTKAIELITSYMKRYDSTYRKMVDHCSNMEAVPKPYVKSKSLPGGVKASGAVEIMLSRLNEDVNLLVTNWLANLDEKVHNMMRENKESSTRLASGERLNGVSRFVQYAHRAMLQIQKSFESVRTMLRMGQKKYSYGEQRAAPNLKMMESEGDVERSDVSTDKRVFAAYDEEAQKREDRSRKLYQPLPGGNRKLVSDTKKKLPCFMLGNCINPTTCGYSHDIPVYEKFLKTVVEYIKTLKDKTPSMSVIEEHFSTDSEGNRLVVDDDILTDFMASCMQLVNEQLTPAYTKTEIMDADGNVGRPRWE